jgi:sporulation protein YlmC with PRC-barrel domain
MNGERAPLCTYPIQQLNFSMLYPLRKRGIQRLIAASSRRAEAFIHRRKANAHCGTLKDRRISDIAEDIRGSKLYGLNNEKLGKIDDVIFDHSTGLIRYVVVDTGGWLTTKEFIVPTDRLRASTEHKDDFVTDLNKKQIESFPPYKDSDLESEEKWAD